MYKLYNINQEIFMKFHNTNSVRKIIKSNCIDFHKNNEIIRVNKKKVNGFMISKVIYGSFIILI